MTTLLVTGAGGRIGRAALPALEADGFAIRAPSRAELDLATADVGTLAEALRGVDVVIHLAGVAHRDADEALVNAVNRDGAARLAQAAALTGVARFVFASTIYAASAPGRALPFTAMTNDAPHGVYGVAKRAAEERMREILGGRLLVLRFAPVLLGPPAGGLGRLLAASRLPAPLPFGALANRRSLASPATVVSALRAAAAGKGAGGKRLNVVPVADAAPVSTAGIVRAFRAARGKGPSLFPAPVALLKAGIRLAAGADVAATVCEDFVIDVSALREMSAKPVEDSRPALEAYAS